MAADVLVIELPGSAAAQTQLETLLVAELPQTTVIVAGEQGPPGRNGVGAGGISYIQDHEPVGAAESETWWNPLTLQLKVFHDNEFEPVSPDGGYF